MKSRIMEEALETAQGLYKAGLISDEKMEEYKALYNAAPDVRKMKDSGVPWIGEIPESWELGKVKNGYEITLGKMLQPAK